MAVTKALANGTHGHARHGKESAAYKAWSSAKERCAAKPPHHHYKLYAARGIVMAPEWRDSFERFLRDMGQPPSGLTLDRIDNDGNYAPGNCRWATTREQSNNKRNNLIVTFRGQRMTFAQAVKLSGAKHYCTAFQRYGRGWSLEDALTQPPKRRPH